MIETIRGAVHTWKIGNHVRKFGVVTLPYREARELAMKFVYNASQGRGEQRTINASHAKKLSKAMQDGEYTPAPASASLTKEQRKKLLLANDQFTLEIDSADPLHLIDASHRFEGMELLLAELGQKLKVAEEEKLRLRLQEDIDEILVLPITLTVYFDGNAQRDFIALQSGRPADKAQIFSLQVQHKQFTDPAFKLAVQVGDLLQKAPEGPFHNLIRFDSRGKAPFPISTLCAKGSADLAFSLIGLAKVGLAQELDAEALAHCVSVTYKTLVKEAPALIEEEKILSSPSIGTKGAATMLLGLATLVAYRSAAEGHKKPTSEILRDMATLAGETLDRKVSGGFSGSLKRELLGTFARAFLEDVDEPAHDDLPLGLLRALSASTYGASPLPKIRVVAEPQPTKKKKDASPEGDESADATELHRAAQ